MRVRMLSACTAAAVAMAVLVLVPGAAVGRPVSDRVLILSTTVSGGAASEEALAVLDLGLTPVIADPSAWAAHTAADFAGYRGIILGDNYCGGSITPAQTNAATWGGAIDGNVLLVGTDPVVHSSQGGAGLIRKGIGFALADPAATGLFATLSCYYHGAAASTPVPFLDGLAPGGFSVTGVGCYNNAHIVASHPALDGLTDAQLSGWSCSVHEAFDKWPASFQVLALAKDFGASFTASDGTIGTPYILARGSGLKTFPLSVTPTSATPAVGTTHTIVAELLDGSTRAPVTGALLRGLVSRASGVSVAEPLGCGREPCTTGPDGTVAFRYRSTEVRTDVVDVWFDQDNDAFPDLGEPQVRASVSWQASGATLATVVLGDSYASGEGSFVYDLLDACHRSSSAWASQLDFQSTSIDVVANLACSGAKIPHVVDTKFKGQAPQLDQLEALVRGGQQVDMVMLTIGGNDAGFSTILGDCFYKRCANGRALNPSGITTSIKNRIKTDILPEIARIAPEATVVWVGYPRLFPDKHSETTGCGWLEDGERSAVNGAVASLSVRGYDLADETDAYFVNSFNALDGAELCSAATQFVPVYGYPAGFPEQGHPTPTGYQTWATHIRSDLLSQGLIEG